MRAWCKVMRETQPVWYDEMSNNWRLFRYADRLQVLNDYTIFSFEPGLGAGASNSSGLWCQEITYYFLIRKKYSAVLFLNIFN